MNAITRGASLFFLMAASLALAQVQVMFVPLDSTAAKLWGPRNGVYVVNVMVVNQSPSAVRISPELLAMAAPNLIPFMPADQGLALWSAKMGNTKKAMAVKAIEYVSLGAAAIGGFGAFQVSAKVVSSLAAGSAIAGQFSAKIAAAESPAGPVTGKLLSSPLTLEPGASDTWVMFSGRMARAAPQKVTLDAALLR